MCHYLASYPCLIELYVQFLIFVDYHVKSRKLKIDSDFLLSQVQTLCLLPMFNLVFHSQHVYCASRMLHIDKLQELLKQPKPITFEFHRHKIVPFSYLLDYQ